MRTSPLHTFKFGRQAKPDGLCLSDYVLDAEESGRDHVALFVVSAGEGVRERVEQAKTGRASISKPMPSNHSPPKPPKPSPNGCIDAFVKNGVSLILRRMTMQERFTSKYRGKRYSFGYGACPNMDDQQGIWKLLQPEDIGVNLTEGMMMEPEASVSALVFHHPDCAYFSVSDEPETAGNSPQ